MDKLREENGVGEGKRGRRLLFLHPWLRGRHERRHRATASSCAAAAAAALVVAAAEGGVRARGGRRRVVGCGFASRLFSLVLLGGGFAKSGGVEDFGPADRMAQKKIVKKPRNWINFTNKF